MKHFGNLPRSFSHENFSITTCFGTVFLSVSLYNFSMLWQICSLSLSANLSCYWELNHQQSKEKCHLDLGLTGTLCQTLSDLFKVVFYPKLNFLGEAVCKTMGDTVRSSVLAEVQTFSLDMNLKYWWNSSSLPVQVVWTCLLQIHS